MATCAFQTSDILAVTMGEPAGIGGEIVLKSWLQRSPETAPFFVVDDPTRLKRIAKQFGLDVPVNEIPNPAAAAETFPRALPVLHIGCDIDFQLGTPDAENARAVCKSIEMATALTLEGKTAAVVTSPIQKKTLYDAGFRFPGHTEFIAHLCGNHPPTMMLATSDLRVVPVSIHEPIARAITSICLERIVATAHATDRALKQDFGIPSPRMAIAGLNPHAGEDGALGNEEIDVIRPAIDALIADGLDVFGPVPPDALFTPRTRQGYDAAICHYHDQALIPIKALAVDEAVNVTVGLPVVRTSPDHGTALDIAAQGIANPQSLICAMEMAALIARNRRAGTPS